MGSRWSPTRWGRSSRRSATGAPSATPSTVRRGMLTLFVRGVLCNWMVSTGVVGAMIVKDVVGKVLVMWMPIMLFTHGRTAAKRVPAALRTADPAPELADAANELADA